MTRFAIFFAFSCLLFIAHLSSSARAADGPPAVSMFSLLEGFDFYPDGGWLRLTNLEISNLPADVYSEYGDNKLWAIVRTADGADKYKISMQAFRHGDYFHGANPFAVEPLTADGQLDGSYFLLDKPGN